MGGYYKNLYFILNGLGGPETDRGKPPTKEPLTLPSRWGFRGDFMKKKTPSFLLRIARTSDPTQRVRIVNASLTS